MSTTTQQFSGGQETISADSEATDTALLEAVDIGRHDGFDRVVFRFKGDAPPGFKAGFVKRPLREDGSGSEVTIDGGAILGVRIEPASGFDTSQGEGTITYTGPKRIDGSAAGAQAITEVVRTGDFEAVLNWAIGLDHETDFRVMRLDAPARIVVDLES
jgi:hypothetical protein